MRSFSSRSPSSLFYDKEMPQILDNALGAVGHTPLIRLDALAKAEGLQCNLREGQHWLS